MALRPNGTEISCLNALSHSPITFFEFVFNFKDYLNSISYLYLNNLFFENCFELSSDETTVVQRRQQGKGYFSFSFIRYLFVDFVVIASVF